MICPDSGGSEIDTSVDFSPNFHIIFQINHEIRFTGMSSYCKPSQPFPKSFLGHFPTWVNLVIKMMVNAFEFIGN